MLVDNVFCFTRVLLQVIQFGSMRQDEFPAIRSHAAQLRPVHEGFGVECFNIGIACISDGHGFSLLDERPKADSLRNGTRRYTKEFSYRGKQIDRTDLFSNDSS